MDYKQFVLEVEALSLSMYPFVFSCPSTTAAKYLQQKTLSPVLTSLRNAVMNCRGRLTETADFKASKYALTLIRKQGSKLFSRK